MIRRSNCYLFCFRCNGADMQLDNSDNLITSGFRRHIRQQRMWCFDVSRHQTIYFRRCVILRTSVSRAKVDSIFSRLIAFFCRLIDNRQVFTLVVYFCRFLNAQRTQRQLQLHSLYSHCVWTRDIPQQATLQGTVVIPSDRLSYSLAIPRGSKLLGTSAAVKAALMIEFEAL